jgi:G3E family GTPase
MVTDAWIIPTVRGKIDSLETLPPPRSTRDPGEAEVITGLESLSYDVPGRPPLQSLRDLFEDLAAGRFGAVERAKGVIETAEGWVRLDVASGLVHQEPWGPAPGSRVAVIGRDLSREALEEAFVGLSPTKGAPWSATA